LQIRLPTGNPLIHTFGAGESLAAVRLYVQLNRVDAPSSTPIRLQTNMPVKIFTEDDMQTPLHELGTLCLFLFANILFRPHSVRRAHCDQYATDDHLVE